MGGLEVVNHGKMMYVEFLFCPLFNSVPFLQPEPETPLAEYTGDHVPRIYRQVEIEYSKFGVEDFDFGLAFVNAAELSDLLTGATLQIL